MRNASEEYSESLRNAVLTEPGKPNIIKGEAVRS